MDSDLNELLKKIAISMFIVLGFTVLLVILYMKKYDLQETKIEKVLNKEEVVFILLRENKCSTCQEIENILQEKQVYYEIINEDKNKSWETTKKNIGLEGEIIEKPALICIKEKNAYSYLEKIEDKDELENYIENSMSIPLKEE